jgi:hypothetical protein
LLSASTFLLPDWTDHSFRTSFSISVTKLLKRIVAPELTQAQLDQLKGKEDIASHLYDYTHGINSDPLATLAVKFSALIHDVDHRGVSNMQLMVEEPNMAHIYSNKSIAEQNSLDLAWDVLMQDAFDNLRACIFNTETELMRFRQLIVNGMCPQASRNVGTRPFAYIFNLTFPPQ